MYVQFVRTNQIRPLKVVPGSWWVLLATCPVLPKRMRMYDAVCTDKLFVHSHGAKAPRLPLQSASTTAHARRAAAVVAADCPGIRLLPAKISLKNGSVHVQSLPVTSTSFTAAARSDLKERLCADAVKIPYILYGCGCTLRFVRTNCLYIRTAPKRRNLFRSCLYGFVRTFCTDV